MKGLLLLVLFLTGTGAVAMETFAGKSISHCSCPITAGCSALSKWQPELPQETCRPSLRTLKVQRERLHLILDGEGLSLRVKWNRPYFRDLDRYQSGRTDEQNRVYVSVDSESEVDDFVLNHFARSSVNHHVWADSGAPKEVE